MKSNILKRLSALAMTAVMAFSISGGVSAVDAATATIDTSRTTSLTLYKYDLTGAENDGVWDSQSYVSTGLADEQVNTALSKYAIQGVEFSYVKLADLSIYKGTAEDGHQETVPLYAFTENTKTNSKETIDFLSALGLTTNDAYRTDHDNKQKRVWYFKSDTLIEALDHALTTNSTSTKDALEKYMAANGGTAMPETDENGYSKVDGLAQGLYLYGPISCQEHRGSGFGREMHCQHGIRHRQGGAAVCPGGHPWHRNLSRRCAGKCHPDGL